MALSAALQAKMTSAGLTAAMPAWTIVKNANLLPPLPTTTNLFGDPVGHAMKKLLKAYYEYGRQNWTWAQSAGAAAANGGLVKGAISAVACGSFNQNFKWLAENALGITGIGNGQETSQFLTFPGGVCIDSKWIGNVRTSTKGFDQLKCFKFYGHYWVTHGGVNYDVCYNNTFTNKAEIVWTELLPPDPKVFAKSGLGAGDLYKLEKPLPDGDHLVKVMQTGPNGWPAWQIVTGDQLRAL